MAVGEMIVGAVAAGGTSVVRMELARLVRSAVTRLSRRGRVARELALVADTAARSDDDFAAALDRLPEQDREIAAGQLDEALSYLGNDTDEAAATKALDEDAKQLIQMLTNHGVVIANNSGMVVNAPGGQVGSTSGPGNSVVIGTVQGDNVTVAGDYKRRG